MDANGRVIPLDTTMMYRNDNSQFHVTDFFYEARPDKWFARSGSECIETNKLYLESKKFATVPKPNRDFHRTFCPIMNWDERCDSFKPIEFGGKKFKVLDRCGLFDSYWGKAGDADA